jgi:hypothetical protein
VRRVTYRQDWHAYNAAQTEEKTCSTALLSKCCRFGHKCAKPVALMTIVAIEEVRHPALDAVLED